MVFVEFTWLLAVWARSEEVVTIGEEEEETAMAMLGRKRPIH